jgi:hypothetical protein
MKMTVALIFFAKSISIFSQDINNKVIDHASLEPDLAQNLVEGYQWSDNLGDNYVLLLKTKPYERIENSMMYSSDLRIVCFASLKEKGRKIKWEHNDSMSDCFKDNDLIAEFIKNSFRLTDVDNNGVCEVWTMYKMNCTTSLSPSRLVLVMYEGSNKYVIKGRHKITAPSGNFNGGDHEMDKNFAAASAVLQDFALKLWTEFLEETW